MPLMGRETSSLLSHRTTHPPPAIPSTERSHTGRHLTLPEGEEDDRLDGEELDDRVEGPQHLPGGVVEQEERVQRQRHAEVVDDGDVQVAAGGAVGRSSGQTR